MDKSLEVAAATKPQLAVVDMTLKGREDGLATARALGEKYSIPVVFLTGSEAFMVRAMSMDIEPLGYVLKPYVPQDILEPLRTIC